MTVENTPEKKIRIKKKTDSQRQSSNAPTSRFVDKRPGAIQMRKNRKLAKHSQQNAKLRELHNLAAHSVAQKKRNGQRGFGFVDNRQETVTQRKVQELINDFPMVNSPNRPVTQMKQALLHKVEDDMVDRVEVRRIFRKPTINWLDGLWENAKGGRSGTDLSGAYMVNIVYPAYKAAVKHGLENGRENIDYQKKLGDNLTTMGADNLIDWLKQNAMNGGKECMYVHMGESITGGAIAHGVKTFHPNLLGGDPDVTCAGTLEFTEYDGGPHALTVTNESGHFQPSEVAVATLTKLGDILGGQVTINGRAFVEEAEEKLEQDDSQVDNESFSSPDGNAQAGSSDRVSLGSLSDFDLGPKAKPIY